MTWNIQEYVSSQYQRKGIQGSHGGECPKQHREYEPWQLWATTGRQEARRKIQPSQELSENPFG